MVLFKHQIFGGMIMDDKYKKLRSLEDEEIEAITGGSDLEENTAIETMISGKQPRKPKKTFNVLRRRGRYRRRLCEKYCSSPQKVWKCVPTTLELRPEDYCEKCGRVICGEGCECGEE